MLRVLLVDDDLGFGGSLRPLLDRHGITLMQVPDAASIPVALDHSVDVVLLDLALGDADGRDVCLAIKSAGCRARVIFVAGKGGLGDRLSGFAVGADDYVVRPCSTEELVARISVVGRAAAHDIPTFCSLRLDPITFGAYLADDASRSVRMSPTEFRLLGCLLSRPTEVVRREDLIRVGWPFEAIVKDNTLDQYLARIRSKLRQLSPEATIETLRGVGYRCVATVDA